MNVVIPTGKVFLFYPRPHVYSSNIGGYCVLKLHNVIFIFVEETKTLIRHSPRRGNIEAQRRQEIIRLNKDYTIKLYRFCVSLFCEGNSLWKKQLFSIVCTISPNKQIHWNIQRDVIRWESKVFKFKPISCNCITLTLRNCLNSTIIICPKPLSVLH